MFYLSSILKVLKINNSIIFGGIVFLLCIPFLYLTFYIHPSGDDYTYAFLELKSPFYKAFSDEYFLWNGRYISNILVLKNPLTFGFNNIGLYRIIVLIIQLGLFSSILLIVSNTKAYLNFISRFIISTCFYLFYLSLIPALNEGFYWYTGLVTYQFCIILFLIYIHILIRLTNKIQLCILIFIQLFIVGCNEIAMLYMLFFNFSLIVFNNKKNSRTYSFILFLSSFIFCLFVYFAPGNNVRSTYFDDVSHQFFRSFFMSVSQVVRFVIVLNSGFLIFISALILYFIIPNLKYIIQIQNRKFYLFIIPIILFILLFISIFPAYWTTGIMGQHRTVNFAFFISIPLMFYWYLIFINVFEAFFVKVKIHLNSFLIIIFLCSLFLTKNFKGVFMDICFAKQLKFDQENIERYDELESQLKQKNKDVLLKKIKTHPFSIIIYDLDKDPNHLANIGYQRYWKVPGKVLLNPL